MELGFCCLCLRKTHYNVLRDVDVLRVFSSFFFLIFQINLLEGSSGDQPTCAFHAVSFGFEPKAGF